jgi:predicted ATPase
LKAQIAWWLSFLTGYEIGPVVEEVTPLQVKVSFSTPDLENISPFNTGAGTSYLLKLLVMCLCAKPDDVLLVENPEIHLHPGAQSRLGYLFAFLASKGIQLVVETHCEHLINRIRYEVYKKKLRPDDCVVYYKPDAQNPFIHININSRGHYTDELGEEINFPQGFFDC